jgi:hypothetical protein
MTPMLIFYETIRTISQKYYRLAGFIDTRKNQSSMIQPNALSFGGIFPETLLLVRRSIIIPNCIQTDAIHECHCESRLTGRRRDEAISL